MKMQKRGRPQVAAIIATRSKELASAGGTAARTPEDAANKWKRGQSEVSVADDHVYLLFDRDSGPRRGLIDANARKQQDW